MSLNDDACPQTTGDDLRSDELNLVVAEAAIARNLTTYAAALDHRWWDQLDAGFTPDVVASYAGGNTCEGVAAVVAYVREALATFTRTQHVMGRSRIVSLDENRAIAETYCAAYLYEEDAGYVWQRGLRYLDTFVGARADWRVSRREQTVDWMTSVAAVSPASAWPGSVAQREDAR